MGRIKSWLPTHGFISCEMCVKAEENNLAWNSNERLMAGVRKLKILDSEGKVRKRLNLKGTGRMPALHFYITFT